ncbi:MAG TPA: universal stress protein [Ktedonobacteraceae bacterium]|nr:universal stress protein [Ktedonobacteraceae bacterium]
MLQHENSGNLHILVPLDGSRLAESVLPVVQQVASRFHAHVTLLHILEQHPPATIHGEHHLSGVAQAQAYLEQIAVSLRSSDIPVEIHVHEEKEDNVAQSIVQHFQALHADLVIMCTHGHGGLREILFGSKAQQALQQGTQSILLLFPRDDDSVSPFNLRRILVPLDGTVAHEPALPMAITIARTFGAELYLVLVIPTLATLSGNQAVSGLLLPSATRAVLDFSQLEAEKYLEHAVTRCNTEGVVAHAEVLRGDIIPQLLGLADRLDVDLIVLASHARTGLDALFTGSVASRIAGRKIRPLLLVRAGRPVV